MPASVHQGVSANLAHLQALGPDDRVQMHNVLEHGNPSHAPSQVYVSAGQMAALKAANRAIDDTWQILHYGSGNQHGHVKSSRGESHKRTALAYQLEKNVDTGHSDPRYHKAFVAASVQSGNCDQMANVNALLLSVSGIHDRVSVIHATDIKHAFVSVGDDRMPGGAVISDAWPEFGRALLQRDFSLMGRESKVVRTYDVAYKPEVRANLLNAGKYSQHEIDGYYAQIDPARGHLDPDTLTHTLLNNPDARLYKQVHASQNLGVSYRNNELGPQVVDQSLSMRQFNERLVKSSSHPPITPPELTWEEMLDISVQNG
ncbi:Hrp-dependent type III effector protein [Pseudomonas syringae group genomosp. 3]|uniref:Type III effector n=1 Tax=Pseudomonas syringae pv. primulae TaxID=251707 RepID=A0A3M3XP99_9PSED|nr:Hrp-dependent type III effector protein [Pseudomonas syringae group genomosp. 3]RMO71354.1 Type III effector [Pseudomonas syringae pv. primulae]